MFAASLWVSATGSRAEALGHAVSLERSGAGGMYVAGEIAGVQADFLVDTGADLVTVDERLFRQMRKSGEVRELRRVAARMANNRLQVMTVYEVAHLNIGDNCDLGPVEVAVMKGAGRNLLGLSALSRGAPFTLGMAPPTLVFDHCPGDTQVAARN
jgi:predicted aspartyl protease